MGETDLDFQQYMQELTEHRRHFHAHPELSLQERETADYIEKYLRDLGLSTKRISPTGITAVVFAGNGTAGKPDGAVKTAAIRAEMDAIAVTERNHFPWKSQNEGVMHACGHDGILATAMVLAKVCVQNRKKLPVNVKFIFQPAEENGQGTWIMIHGGAMEAPHVDYFTMFHYANDRPCGMDISTGPSSAAIGSIALHVRGRSGHWGNPVSGVDSIRAAAAVVDAADEMNHTFPSAVPFVIGIGKISGGTAKNVIAEETRLEGTIRAGTEQDYARLRSTFLRKISEIEKKYDVRIEGEIDDTPVPPIVSDPALIRIGYEAGREVFGDRCHLVDNYYLSGDSAAYYFQRARGLNICFPGQIAGKKNYPFHTSCFDFDESVMVPALETLWNYLLHLS